MGLFSKKPEAYKVSGKYYASHGDIKGVKSLVIMTDEAGVHVTHKRKFSKDFTWDEVVSFKTETQAEREESRRITATRLLAVGVFALAFQKHTGKVQGKFYHVLLTTSGEIELENMIAGGAPSSLAGSMANYSIVVAERESKNMQRFVAERATGKLPEVNAGSASVADELEKFAKLRDSGVISKQEFEAKKKQLLDL